MANIWNCTIRKQSIRSLTKIECDLSSRALWIFIPSLKFSRVTRFNLIFFFFLGSGRLKTDRFAIIHVPFSVQSDNIKNVRNGRTRQQHESRGLIAYANRHWNYSTTKKSR